MATYAETRDDETLRLLTPAIDAFIAQCQRPPNQASACPRQTVFFFPGGMASRLRRATRKFVDGAAGAQVFNYNTVWVTLNTPLGGARDLKMYRDSAGTFRDKGDYIIVADAPLALLNCTPHDGFIAWCVANNVDLFVFPWDWRRRLEETVTFFVGKFLPFFRARVQNAGCPDPLAQFALVGHSFGGMIANLLLRRNNPILANITRVITVATPFYGYSGQVHRWFEGDSYVNLFGIFKQEMMEMIASLPALYVLHFLDEATFNNGTNQAALTAPTEPFPLPGYPSRDAANGNVLADAYNPQTSGALVRYPTLTGFDRTELDYARLQFQYLASPMDPNLAQKFYNVRGVRTEADEETPINDTVGNITWAFIPTSFDSGDPSPIVDVGAVPGDNTQPAWSTCLATNANRCLTVKASNIDHMFMMNHVSVLAAIQTVLCAQGAAVNPAETPQPEPASDDDMVEFLSFLYENRLRVKRWPDLEDPELRKVLPAKFRDKLPSIARRFISDVMKRPGPPGLRGPEGGAADREPRGPEGKPPKEPDRRPAARQPAGQRGPRPSPKKKKQR